MRNRLVDTNITIKTFGGFALSQKTTKTTGCTTRAHPKLSRGCDWLKGYSGIQEYNTEELTQYTEYKIGFFFNEVSFSGLQSMRYNLVVTKITITPFDG